MEYDKDKVDETTLALLYLTSFTDEYGTRAWKGMAWEVLDRLYEQGYIHDPKGKAKSVALTEIGENLSEALFLKYFGLEN
jgi:hypothetical protein